MKLRPLPQSPLVDFLREVWIWIAGIIAAVLFSLPLIKDLIFDFPNFLQSFYPKVPAVPPAAYHKQPNSEKEWNHKEIYVGGVNFHYVEHGDPANQTMLFLHGFPEFWYSWRHQLIHFSKSYRVIAIDLKGYAESDKPEAVSAYRPEVLVQDMTDLVVEFKNSTLFQRITSIYTYFFALPYYPEFLLRRKNYEVIKMCFLTEAGLVHKDKFTEADEQMYVWALSRPQALSSAFKYYRNLVRGVNLDLSAKVKVPTLVIWGVRDYVLRPSLLTNLQHWVPGVSIKYVEDAGHWVQQDTPDKVNAFMEEWLTETSPCS